MLNQQATRWSLRRQLLAWTAITSFWLLISSSFAANPAAFHALIDGDRPIVDIESRVHVFVLDGFGQSPSGDSFSIDTKKLENLLRVSLGGRTPYMTSSSAFHQAYPLAARHNITYTVTRSLPTFASELEGRVTTDALLSSNPSLVEVPTSSVESYIESVVQSLHTSPQSRKQWPLSVAILQLNTSKLLEDKDYVYVEPGGKRCTNWVTPAGVMVLDITAYPVSRGSSNSPDSEVDVLTVPSLTSLGDINEASDPSKQLLYDFFLSRIAAFITAGVQHVFVPDALVPDWLVSANETTDAASVTQHMQRVAQLYDSSSRTVPVKITVYHDHPVGPNEDFGFDSQAIVASLKPLLLPLQKMAVSVATVQLQDSPDIAIAVTSALRSIPIYVRVDTAGTLQRHARTVLQEDKLSEALWNASGGKDEARGTLNVIVLSLHHNPTGYQVDELTPSLPYAYNSPLLFENDERVAVSDGFVFLLRSPSAILHSGCFIGSDVLLEDGSITTPKIVAGLASVLAYALPVELRWSPVHGRAIKDYSWSMGVHSAGDCFDRSVSTWVETVTELQVNPVAPVVVSTARSEALKMSTVLVRLDTSIRLLRHSIRVVHAFAYKYLYDPFTDNTNHSFHLKSLWLFDTADNATDSETEAMSRQYLLPLQKHLHRMLDMLRSVESFVRRGEVAAAIAFTATFHSEVERFVREVVTTVTAAEEVLSCCTRRHLLDKPHADLWTSSSRLWIIIAITLTVSMSVLAMWLHKRAQHTKTKKL